MLSEKEVQEYLEKLQKTGQIHLGLDSIRRLMAELGNVQEQLQVIHVAGTNGKGSVCAMLTSILMEAGYRVGTYTSPAVFGRSEQYQINRIPISGEEFAELFTEVKEACDRMAARGESQPTVFEVETAAAFLYFYRKGCQAVVLETGMGGETDATNIIRKPLVSVLTSISMDHMKFLGNDLESIARVKAGIIKENGSAVALKPPQEKVRRVLEEECRRKKASLVYAGEEAVENIRREEELLCFSYGELGELGLSMTGAYQVQNAACAAEAAKILREKGMEISDSQIKQGLENARWEGRFSVLLHKPLFVIDGAHNEDAAKKLRETLKMGFTNRKIIYIIGVLADKEHEKMLKLMLPLAWKVFTVTPGSPRALDGAALAREAERYHRDVTCCLKVSEAVEQAMAYAVKEQAMILSFGSLSYLGEIKEALKENIRHDR